MKIQRSDTCRFLQRARKIWKSTYEGDALTVVFTFTENCCSIAMVKSGLMLTYLCSSVDLETEEQVIAVPLGLLQDCSIGNGIVDLQVDVENGESYVVATWSDELVQCERKYATHVLPDDHLIPDLAWQAYGRRADGTYVPLICEAIQRG